MNSALFTYPRTDRSVKGVETINMNYINPAHVISAYWSTTEQGLKVMNVFTSAITADENGVNRTMRVTFGEKTGERFIEHLEAFYALLLNPMARPSYEPQRNQPQPNRGRNHKRSMNVIDPDMENLGVAVDPVWESEPAI